MYFLDVMAQLRFNSFPEACTPFVLKFCVWNLDEQVPISHVDEGEDGVEGCHHHVSECQVQEEIIRHTPHSAMC